MRDTSSNDHDAAILLPTPSIAELLSRLEKTSHLMELSSTLRLNAKTLREEAEALRRHARQIRTRQD